MLCDLATIESMKNFLEILFPQNNLIFDNPGIYKTFKSWSIQLRINPYQLN